MGMIVDKLYTVHTVHLHLITHFLNQQNAHFLFILQYNFFLQKKPVNMFRFPIMEPASGTRIVSYTKSLVL